MSYLQDCWQQGCANSSQLYRELVALGYPGSRSLLHQALEPWRAPRPPPRPRERWTARRSLRWLCLRPPEQLDDAERAALANALGDDPDLGTGYDLLQRFRALVRTRDRAALDGWLNDAEQSGLARFAAASPCRPPDSAAPP